MTIASNLENCLQNQTAKYQVMTLSHSEYSMEITKKTHVQDDALARGVPVKNADDHLLVDFPADYVTEIESLRN